MKITGTTDNKVVFKTFKVKVELTIETLDELNDIKKEFIDAEMNKCDLESPASSGRLEIITKLAQAFENAINDQVESK